ncbi:GIY-YIG nuclease family protein [Methanobrevibacter sp. DSM 116169]|uniref:GIY-YIG nuclease family protein n=1 Tax=Methanobrevibacter sp. DSM 116169 TaxID=3242727 RepID=UPI0038FD1960
MKGTYCLIIELKKDSKIKVGSLGFINFKKGFYIYVGSAMSSLESRVKRHLSSSKKKHWHIDYLLLNSNSQIIDVIFNISDSKIECDLAKYILNDGLVVENFGSSDCKCISHLIYFENKNNSLQIAKESFNKLDKTFHNLNYFKENF